MLQAGKNMQEARRSPRRSAFSYDPWLDKPGFATAVKRGIHMRLCVAPDGKTAPISKIHAFIKAGGNLKDNEGNTITPVTRGDLEAKQDANVDKIVKCYRTYKELTDAQLRTYLVGQRDLEQVILQVAYWADKAARLEMAAQFGKEISTTLEERVAAIQGQVKDVQSEIANASRIWDNAQTGIASGRVAYAKRREDIIREMIADEKKMNALMEQINKVEAAQTRATSSNTSKYTDDGRILMSEQDTRDFTSVSKMLAENLRTLKKQAGFSLHSTKDRDPKNTLKVPTQLEEMCRGEELRTYMQAFLDDRCGAISTRCGPQ